MACGSVDGQTRRCVPQNLHSKRILYFRGLFFSSTAGKHVLVAYIMKPKAGYDYLATAAHFAAESSTGTNVNVCTTDDFTKSVDALVYYIDPDSEDLYGLGLGFGM